LAAKIPVKETFCDAGHVGGFWFRLVVLSPQPLPIEERDVIRSFALLLSLALAQPALAQTAPTAAPNPSPIKPSPAKPSPTKPSPAKPAAKKPEPPKPDAAAQSGPCGIGVIPHIGENFALKGIGLTMFGNELKDVPIESWGLDDLIVARVRAAAGPGLAVRRITYPASAFETYDHHVFLRFPNIKAIVQTVAGTSGCERYVLVVKGRDAYGDSNQLLEGIGVAHSSSIFDRSGVTYLFALTGISIFNGDTFDAVHNGTGSLHPEETGIDRVVNSLTHPFPIHGPGRELKDFPWPPAPDAITGLRDPTRALLGESLDKVLPKLLAP
jgi:hypothetical protein